MTDSARRLSGSAFIFAALAPALAAQSPQVPAADAVSVGRVGAGVAFGRSLEAATLNPALLPTLEEKGGFYAAAGWELQASQITLQSNQTTAWGTDRNRLLAGFGLGMKGTDQLSFGLKLDQPWERHGLLAEDAPGRFLGRELDFGARRLEAQVAYELPSHPGISFGLGLGVTRLSFTGINTVRALVPQDGSQPASSANPTFGLAEQGLSESGSATRPSFTLGGRWAISPRWTLGATYQSKVSGDLSMSAGLYGDPSFYGINGYGPVLAGVSTQGATMLSLSSAQPGNGRYSLPARASLGVRNRLNNIFTWEFDLRATKGGLRLPGWASLDTLSGPDRAPAQLPGTKHTIGFSAMGEVDLTKRLVLRGGIAYDPAFLPEDRTSAVLGGQAAASFGVGATYRIWGGELSAGYAYRQSRDAVVPAGADGNWDLSGYRPSGTPARIEGMGHLISLGYKIAF